ncbi:MAG TPA: alpha/beta hydrolase [Streptosporangiaceae bacterium]|jgi:pimeloyl-ACP methyl ester carboxylesterase
MSPEEPVTGTGAGVSAPLEQPPAGLESHYLGTGPNRLHVLTSRCADPSGPLVCLLHGNLSTARFFEPTALALPPSWDVILPDLRGFGRSGAAAVEATRGLRDFAEDLDRALSIGEQGQPVQARPVHLAGWSMGGGVVMQYAIDHPERVASVTLISPVSPFGFGGTRGEDGELCRDDGAGSGGGVVAGELVRRITEADRSDDSQFSPRSVLRAIYLKPPLRLPLAVEDLFVDEILATATGDDNYPGDHRTSPHWPGVAPGTRGVANTMAPLYCDLSKFAEVVAGGVPVLWVRGADDQIVSDTSLIDVGYLGAAGVMTGWPGEEFPAQPMVSQTRAMLRRAQAAGGTFTEVVFPDCGHSPHLEYPARFVSLVTDFITATEAPRI